jgi:hypothetical protein
VLVRLQSWAVVRRGNGLEDSFYDGRWKKEEGRMKKIYSYTLITTIVNKSTI